MEQEEKSLFPIEIISKPCLELIAEARELEWMTDPWGRRYFGKMGQVWELLAEKYGLDLERFKYRINGNPPKIYNDGEKIESSP